MKFVLTCIAWVESLARREIEKSNWKIEEITDRLITFSWWIELIPRVNLSSRVWNKLYILLEERENIKDFDSLFDLMSSISWKKYFKKNFPILIKASSERSDLFSEKTIQSIWKKSIVNSLVWEDWYYEEDNSLERMEILVLIINNKLRIMLNTSWKALHMRWYRQEAWEAPLKESLAAALVLLSDWKFKENLYDPFCWSWTIAIEALMIAKNIAPWLKRKFAFEEHQIVNSEITENERLLAKKREYSWEYKIIASDIDSDIIKIAKSNAKRAWLEWEIEFLIKDFNDYLKEELTGTLISNPPYWDRLKPENISELYKNIDKLFIKNKELNAGIISSYMDFDNLIKKENYKKRKLYNWWEMCYFWRKT